MHTNRRLKLLEKVNNQSIVILFSGRPLVKTADQYYDFSVNRNFYYLTNLEEANMALVMIKVNNQVKKFIFKEIRDEVRELWEGKLLSAEEIFELSKIDEVKDIKTLHNFITQITGNTRANIYGKLTDLYLDLEASNLDSESYKFIQGVEEVHPYLKINNLHNDLASLRMIKDSEEINKIKEAIKITNLGLNEIMNSLDKVNYEYEVEAHYNFILNKNKVTTSFQTIAASGHNATVLHYSKNSDKLNQNDLILLDLGVDYQNYASDISRTYPVSGKFSKRQKEIYEIVLKANKETIKMLKPGVTWKEFNDFSKEILANGLLKLGLIKEKEELSKYYYHSIGHFLGLDVHDVGTYQVPLEAGMVVTVEPGLYISEENIGIRIEDDILITESGAINLSKDIIKEVSDIEAYMAKNS